MPRPAPTVPPFYPPQQAASRAMPVFEPPAPPERSRKRRVFFWLLRWGFIASVWLTLAAAVTMLWFARDLPRPESALDAVRRPSLTLQDRSGHVIATFGDLVGEPLRLKDFAPVPARGGRGGGGPAVLASPRHRSVGVAPRRLGQPHGRPGRAGRIDLTQQVAKTLFLTNARTMQRKVQELLLTLWLEHHFTKQEILEIYLNRVYLGSGAWGMDAAATHVFRRLGPAGDAVAGGGAGRAAAGAVAVQPAGQPRRRDRSRQGSAGGDGG